MVKVNGMYAVNGDFFRSAYRGNGIVLSETCEFYGKNGHVDTSSWQHGRAWQAG